MPNNSQLKRLQKREYELAKKAKHIRLYNFKNKLLKNTFRAGYAINHTLPFVIVACFLNSVAPENYKPFVTEQEHEIQYIESTDTSNGNHFEKRSKTIEYDTKKFEYSTGWIKNENGLYEREVTSYELTKDLDLENILDYLSMPKEEIEKQFSIQKIEKIQKKSLDPEDCIYTEDQLLITDSYKKELDTTVEEPALEIMAESAIFWFISSAIGELLRKHIFSKSKKIITELESKVVKEKLEPIHLEAMQRINKENLSLFTEETCNKPKINLLQPYRQVAVRKENEND